MPIGPEAGETTAQYLARVTCATDDEQEAMERLAKRWERTTPQTPEEARAGVLHEREARLNASQPWADKLRQSLGQSLYNFLCKRKRAIAL